MLYSSARTPVASRRAGSGLHVRERRMAWTIIVPAVLFYLLFRYYPVGQTLLLSLTDAQLLKPDYRFTGFQNFADLFADPLFRKVLLNSFVYAAATTLGTTLLALGVALLFEPITGGAGLLRLIYYLPTVTSAIAIATIWRWLYQPRQGAFNQLLGLLDLGPVPWLSSPRWAMTSLILMGIWAGVGFAAILFIAGLHGIPATYREAALIDGATSLQVIRYIKLPLLAPVINFVVVTGIIGSFQVFQQVYLMTGGGPLDATRVLALHIYDTAFMRLQIGQAAAMSFVMFVVVGLLTLIQLRWQRSDT